MILMTNPFRKRVPFPIKRKKLSIAENPKTLFRTRLGSSNVSFKYLYRDASNYKLHGEAVFTNSTFMPIDEIEKQIRSCLKDGEFFIARQVNIEERFFDVLHKDDDHPWHEFNLVEITTEPAFDPENWNQHVFYKLKSAQFIIEKVPTLKVATLKLLSKRGPLYY